MVELMVSARRGVSSRGRPVRCACVDRADHTQKQAVGVVCQRSASFEELALTVVRQAAAEHTTSPEIAVARQRGAKRLIESLAVAFDGCEVVRSTP